MILNNFYRRVKDAKVDGFSHLLIHFESEADMKGRKAKIYSQGTSDDVSLMVWPSFRIGPEFQCTLMGDGIVRSVNDLYKQSTFQMTLIAFCPFCRLGFKRINGKQLKINPQRSLRRR